MPPLPRRPLLLALGPLLLGACRQRTEPEASKPGEGAAAASAQASSSAAPGGEGGAAGGEGGAAGGEGEAAGGPGAAGAGGAVQGEGAQGEARWAGLGAEVAALVEAAIERHEAPGAVVEVSHRGRVVLRSAHGARSLEPHIEPMTGDTLFDLASLTKPVATATLAMLLVEQGRLALGAALEAYFPELRGVPLGFATPEHLLLHTAGLDADLPPGSHREGIASVLALLRERPLLAPPGERFRYSDIGYQLLGELAQRLGRGPLRELFSRWVAAPLGRPTLGFQPAPGLRATAAPTELRGGRWLRGEAHDPRVASLGGAAGHAGLFATAEDLGVFCRMLLAGGAHEGKRVLGPRSVERLLGHRRVSKGTRTLGWDVDSGMLTCRGEAFPPRGVGHLGFTGTSLWLDPPTATAVVLLTSRLHPEGKGNVGKMRREVSTAVGRRAMAAVERGLEVAATAGTLRGKRVGLLTHAAAVDVGGRRSVDVLRAAGVEVVALFSPEHGLEGKVDQHIGDGRDEPTGLPIYSLYGGRRRPGEEQLKGLDALVIDLQDAGCRFYTYLSTTGYALEEASKQRLPVIILDRPNPLGGVAVEGPQQDEGRTSFVGYHRLPVRHGLTLGELARLVVAERGLGVPLEVVPMRGWRRSMLWEATGLVWRNPSPNLRSAQAALLYPGVGLLEMTNLSVGRGTERPFELVGAPWVDGEALARRLAPLPGLRAASARFTPTSGPFAGEACRGLSLTVTDAAAFEPLRLGVALALALRRAHPADWEPARLDTLLLHRATLAAVQRGADAVGSVVDGWQPEREAFLERRRPFLLYE